MRGALAERRGLATSDKPLTTAPRPIGWLALPLWAALAPFVPRRLAARIGRTSLPKAVVVHLAAIALAIALALCALVADNSSVRMALFPDDEAGLLDRLRLPFAVGFSATYLNSGTALGAFGGLVAALAVYAGFFALTILLIPFFAEPSAKTSRMWANGVRAFLWSAALAIWVLPPFGVLAGYCMQFHEENDWRDDLMMFAEFDSASFWTCLLAPLAWLWLGVLIRLTPALPRREATCGEAPSFPCAECGYDLRGLSTDGRCPECGRDIARSDPSTRRASAWAVARGPAARVSAFWSTLWSVLWHRDFFDTLAVQRPALEPARFVRRVAFLAGVLVAGALALGVAAGHGADRRWFSNDWISLACDLLVVPWCFLILVALLALVASRFGMRRPLSVVGTICYASCVLLRSVMVLILIGCAIGAIVLSGVFDDSRAKSLRAHVDVEAVGFAVAFALLLVQFGLDLLRIRDALRRTRYAAG